MKKTFYILFLLIWGCNNSPQNSSQAEKEHMQREIDSLNKVIKDKKVESEPVPATQKESAVTTEQSNKYKAENEILNENDQLVEQLLSMKAIKLNMDLYKVYIKAEYWEQIDIQLKENVTIAFLKYFQRHSKEQFNSVDVYDLYSGKKLADYDPMMGFDIEN
jgi:hypothetical protein